MSDRGREVTGARCIIVRPELRDSNIERERSAGGPDQLTVYWTLNALFPPSATDEGWFVQRGLLGTIAAGAQRSVRTLIVPEPLWLRYWPRTVAVALATRIVRSVLRRPSLKIGYYAIDNLEVTERLTLPALDGWPRINAAFSRLAVLTIRVSAAIITDRVVYGTTAAHDNYVGSGLSCERRLESAVIPEVHGSCPVCFPDPTTEPMPVEERPARALFLGEFSPRKGIDALITAWSRSSLPKAGWELVLCGSGELDAQVSAQAAEVPSISIEHPARDEVHALLRTSRAVVLPSRRVPRWQEQIGLSMLEGESHGCALIVSDESGAAPELRDRANAQVVSPAHIEQLVIALDALPHARSAHPCPGDSGAEVRAFLMGGTEAVGVAHA